MEGVRSPSAEIEDCYLKTIFPNMLPDKFLYFISDMGVADPRYYDQQYRKLSLHLQEFSFKKTSLWKLVTSLEASSIFFNRM